MDKKMVLGLDLGTNSIGWALIEYTADGDKLLKPASLMGAGVRIFPQGVDDKTQESRNLKRREARSARRVHHRRNQRVYDLKSALREKGLLPSDKDDMEILMRKNPYALRAAGLDNKLEPFEFGRAVYHLGHRRGFKSNRKDTAKKEKEGKDIKKAVSLLREGMKSKNCRTLGEYLNKKLSEGFGNPIRGHYSEHGMPERSMCEEEFNALWESQSKHHRGTLTDELRSKIHNVIFFQRHYDIRERWGKNLEKLPDGANARRAPELGRCEYEKDKRRSSRGTWHAQRFRMLQDVNNLEVVDTGTGEVRGLSSEEREKLILTLGEKKDMKFDAIRKLLDFTESMEFNLERGGRKTLKGNSAEWNLRVVFKKRYDELSVEERDEIIRQIISAEDEEALRRQAKERWKLEDEAAERLLNSELDSGYLNLSEKALKKMLPHMEKGLNYMDAVEAAGYLRRDQREGNIVKGLSINDIPNIANPIVSAALHQTRRVVNAVISEYGKPSEIRVEIIRELKNSKERRKETIKEQRKNEEEREKAEESLTKDCGISSPRPNDIVKYRLWKECNYECPYTGRKIPKEALFNGTDWEIEHIIPYPRSMDDGYMNKTLCFSGENKAKHNKTPWEAYGHDEKTWEEICKRIKRFPEAKKARFYQKQVDDKFLNSQLSDTAYITREARSFLEKLVGRNKVKTSKGQITAELRRLWGLNAILGRDNAKNREDNRHHAIDAIVTALASEKILKRVSVESQRYNAMRPRDFEPPFDGFRDEVKKAIEKIIVSHKVRRKVSGALHEETNYGILDKKDAKDQPLYAVRKPLAALTASEVERIGDAKVKELVLEHLKINGVDAGKKNNEKSPEWKAAMEKPVFLPNKNGAPIPIKRVRLHKPSTGMIPLGYRAVEPGSNHHIVIFKYADGKKKGRWDGEVFSMFDAAQRLKEKKPVIQRDLGEGKKFVMSLSINEMVRIGEGEAAKYYKVQKIDGSNTVTFRLHTAATIDNNEERLFKNPNTLREAGAIKVTVTPTGKVKEAND